MAITPQSYKGMRDHLPEGMRLRQFIIETLTEILERYGFEPLATPILEYAQTLDGKIGDEEKLLFRFNHGDDTVALRYDQTVPLARVVAANTGKLAMPFKRYALGQSYRGERPQRGRYREFWQLDADIVGVASPIADAEIVAVVCEGLAALGFSGAKTFLNHREILSGLARVAGVDAEAASGVYRAIDKLDKIGHDGVNKALLESGISASAAEQIGAFIKIDGPTEQVLDAMEAALAGDEPALAGVANLREIVAALKAFGIDEGKFAVAPSLARGLSYYTGCVFEAVLDSPPMGSLLGGGRYDDLIGMFAKNSLPTVGCAFGLERLYDLMVELKMGPQETRHIDVYVTQFDSELGAASLGIAAELRAAGLRVLTAYAPGKLGNQFKEADRKGAKLAVVLGPDDAANGVVQVKNLSTGQQAAVARAELLAGVRSALSG